MLFSTSKLETLDEVRKKRNKMTISTHLAKAMYKPNKLPEPLGIQTRLALIPLCSVPKSKTHGYGLRIKEGEEEVRIAPCGPIRECGSDGESYVDS